MKISTIQSIQERVYLIRSQRVMLDQDLAAIYGVSTKRLNQQVRRNKTRFPPEFMFQLNAEEAKGLRLQNATLDKGRGRYRKYSPYVFTEHGAIMISAILNTAVAVSAGNYKKPEAKV